MAFSKKDMAALLASQTSMLKELAKANPALLKTVEEMEKKISDGLGATKTIGPCAMCKNAEVVKEEKYELKAAAWFKCPHGDLFCPSCIHRELETLREKRKEAKEKDAKTEKKDEKKKK